MKSLNEHAKEHTNMKIIHGRETVVTEKERKGGVCGKEECNNKAAYISNFLCKERLLCNDHADTFVRKNSQLPPEMWFCKPLGFTSK